MVIRSSIVFIFFCFIFSHYSDAANPKTPLDEYFTITGPKSIRATKDYTFSVIAHTELKKPKKIRIAIEGTTDCEQEVFIFKDVKLQQQGRIEDTLNTTGLLPGKYKLVGYGKDFYQEVKLHYNIKKLSFLIQTNKPIYKASDVVRFRVFAVDSQTKPYKFSCPSSEIHAIDANHNRVRRWMNVSFDNGIFEGEFNLSASPIIGKWFIWAEGDDELAARSFEVTEYIAPLFEILLDVPSYVVHKNKTFSIKITIKSTVKSQLRRDFRGIANITIKNTQNQVFYKRAIIVDGETVHDIDIENDLNIHELEEDEHFFLDVESIEELTGKVIKTSSTFLLAKTPYKINFKSDGHMFVFKPILPYQFKLAVVNLKNQPIREATSNISVEAVDDEDNVLLNKSYKLNQNGEVNVEIENMPFHSDTIEINAKYEDASFTQIVNRINSQLRHFMTLRIATTTPRLFDIVDLEILTTEKVKTVYVQFFAGSVLMLSKEVSLIKKKAKLSFIPKFAFAPDCSIIAFYIRNDGQIISSISRIDFITQLPNHLDLSISTNQTSPGKSVSLTASTTINSTVSLMAVDERLLHLGGGNDITHDYIFLEEMSKYNYIPFDDHFDNNGPLWYPYDSHERKFFDIGAVVITNAQNSNLSIELQIPSLEPFTLPPNVTVNNNNYAVFQSFDALKNRKNLYDSFLWQTDLLGRRSSIMVRDKVPEPLTTWVITGVALSEETGLGLSEVPVNLSVSKPFYLELSLPYSVRINEVYELSLLLHSNLGEDQDTIIKFNNTQLDFEIIDGQCLNWTVSEDKKWFTYSTFINASSILNIKLKLKILRIGLLPINIIATCSKAQDTIDRHLRSLPDGIPNYQNQAKMINPFFSNSTQVPFKSNLTFNYSIPDNIMRETVEVKAIISGDLLANSLENLNNLVRKPFGCGEQNMVNFVPNVVILEYLCSTNQLTVADHDRIIALMELGYQRELNHRRTDGSFSPFGSKEMNGSTFLTAYVVKYFRKAQGYIEIEEAVIEEALHFIISKQDPVTGQFIEDGTIFYNPIQSNPVALTAYISISLLENTKHYPQFAENVQKALEFVENNYDKSDLYSLVLTSYAFSIDPFEHTEIFTDFYDTATITNEYFYWDYNQLAVNKTSKSINTEITAYGLLTLYQVPELGEDAIKMLNWLVEQLNSLGGFETTQDTVVAIEAISKFAARFVNKNEYLNVTLHLPSGDLMIPVNYSDPVVQTVELPPTLSQLQVSTFGTGTALIQLTCNYYSGDVFEDQNILISISYGSNTCEEYLEINVCINYIPEYPKTATNMIYTRIQLPSGFTYQGGSEEDSLIKRIERENNGNSVVLYLSRLTEDVTCISIEAYRTEEITDLKSSLVEVYDLYDSNIKGAIFYSTPDPLPRCINRTNTEVTQKHIQANGRIDLRILENDQASGASEDGITEELERYKLSLEFGMTTCEEFLTLYICIDRRADQIPSENDYEVLNVELPLGFVYSGGTPTNDEILDITKYSTGNEVEFLVKSDDSAQTCILINANRKYIPMRERKSNLVEIYNTKYPDEKAILKYWKPNPLPPCGNLFENLSGSNNTITNGGANETVNTENLNEPVDYQSGVSETAPADQPTGQSESTPADHQTEESETGPANQQMGQSESAPANELTGESESAPANEQTGESESAPANEQTGESETIPANEQTGESESAPANQQTGESETAPANEQTGESESAPANEQTGQSESAPGNGQTGESESAPANEQTGESESAPANEQTGQSESAPGNGQTGESETAPADHQSGSNETAPVEHQTGENPSAHTGGSESASADDPSEENAPADQRPQETTSGEQQPEDDMSENTDTNYANQSTASLDTRMDDDDEVRDSKSPSIQNYYDEDFEIDDDNEYIEDSEQGEPQNDSKDTVGDAGDADSENPANNSTNSEPETNAKKEAVAVIPNQSSGSEAPTDSEDQLEMTKKPRTGKIASKKFKRKKKKKKTPRIGKLISLG